jgi:hypothetical protein
VGIGGMLSRSIFQHIIRMNIIDDNSKITICRPVTFERGIPVTAGWGGSCSIVAIF